MAGEKAVVEDYAAKGADEEPVEDFTFEDSFEKLDMSECIQLESEIISSAQVEDEDAVEDAVLLKETAQVEVSYTQVPTAEAVEMITETRPLVTDEPEPVEDIEAVAVQVVDVQEAVAQLPEAEVVYTTEVSTTAPAEADEPKPVETIETVQAEVGVVDCKPIETIQVEVVEMLDETVAQELAIRLNIGKGQWATRNNGWTTPMHLQGTNCCHKNDYVRLKARRPALYVNELLHTFR